MEIFLIILYLVLGLIVGFFSGAFGVGGGVIMVPAFLFLFKQQGFNHDLIPKIAIASSLFSAVIASSAGAIKHFLNKNVDMKLGSIFAIFAVLSGFFLSFVAVKLSGDTLRIIFAVVLFFVAIRLMVGKNSNEDELSSKTNSTLLLILAPIFGAMVGSLSAFVGIGGGLIAVPIFHYIFKLKFKSSIGTSSYVIIFSALSAVISYIISGQNNNDLPKLSLGYVYLLASIPTAIGTIFTAPLGANFANKSKTKLLKFLFAMLIIASVVKIIFEII
ncbi:MAG: sulfite exporter TauE/SafE family protein [Ignavibacteria bacterium]|nr:sulfite exporter TauE/SafE family protein [Ignavibacteria bacterium]